MPLEDLDIALLPRAAASTRELIYGMGNASSEAAIQCQHATRERDARLAGLLGDLIERRVRSRWMEPAYDDASEPSEQSG